jgi:hypothetical protein
MELFKNIFIICNHGEIKNIDVSPILQGDRVYLPARIVAEEFGYEVAWNDQDKTVTIKPDSSSDRQQIELIIKNLFECGNREDVDGMVANINQKQHFSELNCFLISRLKTLYRLHGFIKFY